MAIGRNFEEAVLKAIASLEYGQPHPRPLTNADASDGESMDERAHEPLPKEVLDDWLKVATDRRMGALVEAFRRGMGIEEVREGTGNITRWFLHRFKKIADVEAEIVATNCDANQITEAQMR